MSGSGERAIDGVTTGVMKLGDAVTWHARHFGIAFQMTSAVTAYEYPHRFVDEQQHGPFLRWWHEHTFTAIAKGATRMIDVVEFRSPLGLLGSMAVTPGSRTPSKRAANRRVVGEKDAATARG